MYMNIGNLFQVIGQEKTKPWRPELDKQGPQTHAIILL